MAIICCGMPRSASTWVYNIVMEACNWLGNGAMSIGFVNLDKYRGINWGNPKWRVAKVHSYDGIFVDLTQHVFLYSYRDIREVAASLVVMKGWLKEDVLNILHNQIIPTSLGWLNHPFRILLPYNKIIKKPISSANLIADSIGIEIDAENLKKIIYRHSRPSVEKFVKDKNLMPDNGGFKGDSVDGETLYWHNHITRAGGKWREIFGDNSFGPEVDQWLETAKLLENNNDLRGV